MDIDKVEKCWQAYSDAVQEAYKRKTNSAPAPAPAPALAVWIVTDADYSSGRVIGVFDSEKKAIDFCDEHNIDVTHADIWRVV